MLPWWGQWEKPEPEPAKEKPVSDTEVEAAEPVHLSEEGRRKAWRLLSLLDALKYLRPHEPISLDEIEQLGMVADGHFDLHEACAALRNGCPLDHLVGIYT